MSIEHAFRLLTLAVMWSVIFLNMRDLRRRKKQRFDEDVNQHQIAKLTGLTVLQIQVAAEAAVTTFHQRIHEMQANRHE